MMASPGGLPSMDELMSRVTVSTTEPSDDISRRDDGDALRAISIILAYCPGGCPIAVLHELGVVPTSGGWVGVDRTSTTRLPLDEATHHLVHVLHLYRGLRRWCTRTGATGNTDRALDTIARLAWILIEIDPDSVIDLFDELEPVLKVNGNFSLMLRYGRLVESACLASSRRDRRVTELRTQATTCAVAWVLQRLGLLEEADRQLDADEKINTSAGERRGLAFTLKCRGRLRRMMAERSDFAPTTAARQTLLSESEHYLLRARDAFQAIGDGDRLMQVTDTEALLARTYLVAGEFIRAEQALKKAQLFHASALPKTAFDMAILSDEITAAVLFTSAASEPSPPPTGQITKALESAIRAGYERNELVARALLARAGIHRKWGLPWMGDAEAARDIYNGLCDSNSAAAIELQLLEERRRITPAIRAILATESPVVRLDAFRLYLENFGAPVLTAKMNREPDEDDPRWQNVISEARRRRAMKSWDLT